MLQEARQKAEKREKDIQAGIANLTGMLGGHSWAAGTVLCQAPLSANRSQLAKSNVLLELDTQNLSAGKELYERHPELFDGY